MKVKLNIGQYPLEDFATRAWNTRGGKCTFELSNEVTKLCTLVIRTGFVRFEDSTIVLNKLGNLENSLTFKSFLLVIFAPYKIYTS